MEPAAHRVVAAADDADPAVATARPQELTVVLLSLLLAVLLPQEVARLLDLGLRRPVLAARVKYLPAVLLAELSRRDELVRLVYHPQMVKATRVLRLPRALPLLRAVDARQACLTRAPLLPRDPHDPLCHPQEAHLPDRALRLLDSFLGLAPGCPPREPQHELVAECSLDFQLLFFAVVRTC